MGTTRIKVIDLSSGEREIKTSRKHAEKLTGVAKIKGEKREKVEVAKGPEGPKVTKGEKTPSSSGSPVTSVPDEKAEIKKSQAQLQKTVDKKPIQKRRHLGQKYVKVAQLIDKNKLYPAREAIDLLYKTSVTRFDPTIEIHLNITDKNMRGNVNLPPAVNTKKQKKILIFASQSATTPKADNQIIWASEKTIDEIESGKLKPNRDFDTVIAQPKYMPQLVKIAKILAPRGLMPNPKNNTVTENVASALESASGAAFEYKSDPSAPIIHTKLGKLSYKPEQLEENLKTLFFAIGPNKIKKAVIKSTMSPAIKLDLSSI